MHAERLTLPIGTITLARDIEGHVMRRHSRCTDRRILGAVVGTAIEVGDTMQANRFCNLDIDWTCAIQLSKVDSLVVSCKEGKTVTHVVSYQKDCVGALA
jgi:hypothetical protein